LRFLAAFVGVEAIWSSVWTAGKRFKPRAYRKRASAVNGRHNYCLLGRILRGIRLGARRGLEGLVFRGLDWVRRVDLLWISFCLCGLGKAGTLVIFSFPPASGYYSSQIFCRPNLMRKRMGCAHGERGELLHRRKIFNAIDMTPRATVLQAIENQL